MHDHHLQKLKLHLQTFGSVRPEAWALISTLLHFTKVNKGESFNRKVGAFAWLATGILKEYNAFSRKKPSIVNFLIPNDGLVPRKLNARYYLKACVDSELYHLEFDELLQLHQQFPELKSIYFALCSGYDEGHEFRELLLEEKSASIKIQAMMGRYREQLNFISKKDFCNYLHLNYDYFCSLYAKLL